MDSSYTLGGAREVFGVLRSDLPDPLRCVVRVRGRVLRSDLPDPLSPRAFRPPALLSLIFALALLTYCTCEAVSLSNVHTLRFGALPLHKGGPAHAYSVPDSED